MSADRWAICPRCLKEAEQEKAAQKQKCEQSYGKVPPDEYLRLRDEAEKPIEVEDTLREDFQIGTLSDGEFYIFYSGECSQCNFSHRFKHEEKLKV